MDFIKDVQALGLLLIVQLAGFFAWVLAALPPVLAILPIPHTAHEWGVAMATGALYLRARHRFYKRRARRASTPPAIAPVLDAANELPPAPRRARRAHAALLGEEKHTTKVRKIARP